MLRALLEKDTEEVDSWSNDTCLSYVLQTVQELSDLLALPDVGAAFRQRLANVTPLEARALVDAFGIEQAPGGVEGIGVSSQLFPEDDVSF